MPSTPKIKEKSIKLEFEFKDSFTPKKTKYIYSGIIQVNIEVKCDVDPIDDGIKKNIEKNYANLMRKKVELEERELNKEIDDITKAMSLT